MGEGMNLAEGAEVFSWSGGGGVRQSWKLIRTILRGKAVMEERKNMAIAS